MTHTHIKHSVVKINLLRNIPLANLFASQIGWRPPTQHNTNNDRRANNCPNCLLIDLEFQPSSKDQEFQSTSVNEPTLCAGNSGRYYRCFEYSQQKK